MLWNSGTEWLEGEEIVFQLRQREVSFKVALTQPPRTFSHFLLEAKN